MKKEQKLEQQQNSDSTADNSQVSPLAQNRLLSAAMSVEEGNKLITEFMGGKTWDNDTFLFPIGESPLQHQSEMAKYFKYHSSWDWLMPVVEKIEETNIVIINAESCEIKTMPFSIQIKDDIEKRYHRYENYIANPQSKILAVWECVVEFIKWYNDNTAAAGSR